MRSKTIQTIPWVILAAAVFAGCLEEPKITDYHAAATDGWFEIGFGYAGGRASEFTMGGVSIHANDEANTGELLATGHLADKDWVIVFDQFSEAAGKAFQDGGIAANLQEHGATGVADTSIPQVHVDMAAWGEAKVTVDGLNQTDPLTGDPTWAAHYMVITTGVRDNETQGIWNQNRTGPYNPAVPSDGYAEEGDLEIHLVLKSHATSAPNATEVEFGPQTVTSANQTVRTHDIFVNELQGSQANLTLHVDENSDLHVRADFRLLDPNGGEVWSQSSVEGDVEIPSFVMDKMGPYRLTAVLQGVDIQYSVTGTVTPPSNIVLNFWWEEVIFGAAAESFEATFAPDHGHE